MAVFSKTEWCAQYGDSSGLEPWNLPGDIHLSTMDGTERWVSILLNKHSPLVERAIRQYVEVSDDWRENKDHHRMNQERRLAFIQMLRAIASGCEELAQSVIDSYDRHEYDTLNKPGI